jgi:arylsulfatase A-like enzyme
MVDTDAVSLSIDIAPTIYSVLGYEPRPRSRLMGRSLVTVGEKESTARRRDTYVVAASYGAVYATLRHNGRRLYIADAVRGGDQAFERDRAGRWTSVQVSEGLRAISQLAIRQHVDELARTYGISGH